VWARLRCGEERRRAEGEDEDEEDLGEESESEWSPMATAAATTDLGRVRVGDLIKPSGIGYAVTRAAGESSESGVSCTPIRWRRWAVGHAPTPVPAPRMRSACSCSGGSWRASLHMGPRWQWESWRVVICQIGAGHCAIVSDSAT
jgi:hypothetical protein